jgi:MFS family permease
MFAYGFLSAILVLYLARLGLKGGTIGLLLSFTLIGDSIVSLWMSTSADRLGRRRMLIVGAALMLFASLIFAATDRFLLLLIAAVVGVISPSGYEVGPFLSIEQAALSEIVPVGRRTQLFAWYNLVGSFATAAGALCGGSLIPILEGAGFESLASYRVVILAYGAIGAILALLFTRLSASVETILPNTAKNARTFGLHHSRNTVMKLSMLFGLDAFAGGFILQSLVAYWFHVRFGIGPAAIGAILFGANILAGLSALAAAKIAARIGLLNTMVFTHLPSNLLLLLIPFIPGLAPAIIVLLVRFSISQMDVPTRQSYVMAVVSPDERSAAGGVTGIARSIGSSISPTLAGLLLSSPLFFGAPFIAAGGLKVLYDILLYRSFCNVRAAEHCAILISED